MKSVPFLLVILFISCSLNAQKIEFKTETIDYGTIVKNSNGERTFSFTNTGSAPLIINRVQSTCGCTIPKKPEAPIMPGEKGEIKVSYDTKRFGRFNKQIIIFSNAKEARKVIRIKGFVKKEIALGKDKGFMIKN